jgi:hypothetical protein
MKIAPSRVLDPQGRLRPLLPFLAGSLLAVLAGASACSSARSAQVTLIAHAEQADAQITVDATPERAVIEVFSPSGIGSAGFTIPTGPVPQEVIFHLHLKGLEQFTFTYQQYTVIASVSSGPGAEVRESVRLDATDPASEQPISAGSPYWMEVQIVPAEGAAASIPLESGYIAVKAPRGWAAAAPRKFDITWIDFYR